MTWRPDRRRKSRRDGADPERALLVALRSAMLPTICLPLAFASLAASATGQGFGLGLAWRLAALALIVNAVCWQKVIVRWRALPRRDDDDQGWRRWWDSEPPLIPGGGPGGIKFDWKRFERDFWSHVREKERQRERELIHASVPAYC